ncbi:MAG: GNAT family N-acetyltransferase [Deltaproteobacteria bacterium]|nr:GNAT family N-acetyltransferase [Deltaproteobacteria bacterium]
MDTPKIRIVDRAEAPRAVSVQMMAFSSDPIMRWLWPEPHEYVRHFPTFVRGFGGRAFEHGAAYVTDDFRGGSLWLPPGIGADGDALETLVTETVAEPARSEAFSILEQIGAAHPEAPHWHLAFLGVDPTQQGKGIGAALLRDALARIDEQRLHSYLESSNPANISLYRRHGFEVIREIRVGGSPPVTPMLRLPR